MPNKGLGIADPVYDALRIRSGQSIAPDLGGGTTGAGGTENKIYVWHADGSTIDMFDPTDAGLTAAIAAASAGDLVQVHAVNITGGPWTVPANIELSGLGEISELTGDVTNNGTLGNLKIVGHVVNNGLMDSTFVLVSSGPGVTQTLSTAGIQKCLIQGNTGTGEFTVDISGGSIYSTLIDHIGGTGTGLLADGATISIFHTHITGQEGAIVRTVKEIANCTFHCSGTTGSDYAFLHDSGTARLSNCSFFANGSAIALKLTANTITLTDCTWNSISGAAFITYGTGDRMAADQTFGHVIQEEGSDLTQRAHLNFVGANVTATDDAGNDATVVTVAESAGVDIASDSANITAVNFLEDGKPSAPAANHRIIYAKSTGVYAEDSAGNEVGPFGGTPSLALDDLTDVDTTGEATGDVIYDNAGTWIPYPLGIGSKVTVSGTKIRFGNVAGGNYLEIDSVTGTLRLAGDATTYDDFRVEASVVKPGATAPNWKAFGPSGNLQALMFEASHHDEAYFELQMPHTWKLGTNIYPHVHWTPINTTAGNVVWELEYAWSNVGDAYGAPGNMATDATAAGGVAWVHKLTDFKEGGNNYISGAGKTLSSMLICRLHRNSNSGSDTLNQDVALLEVDFHYQIDSLGSDEPLVKDASASLLLETGDILLLESGDRLLLE